MRVKIGGTVFEVDKQGITESLQGIEPNAGGRYFIELDGTTFPIRQALAAALGIPAIALSTNHCYAVLQKIGFDIQEVNKN